MRIIKTNRRDYILKENITLVYIWNKNKVIIHYNDNNININNNDNKYSFEEQMTKSSWLKASDGISIWPSRSLKAISCLARYDATNADQDRPKTKGSLFRPSNILYKIQSKIFGSQK